MPIVGVFVGELIDTPLHHPFRLRLLIEGTPALTVDNAWGYIFVNSSNEIDAPLNLDGELIVPEYKFLLYGGGLNPWAYLRLIVTDEDDSRLFELAQLLTLCGDTGELLTTLLNFQIGNADLLYTFF